MSFLGLRFAGVLLAASLCSGGVAYTSQMSLLVVQVPQFTGFSSVSMNGTNISLSLQVLKLWVILALFLFLRCSLQFLF